MESTSRVIETIVLEKHVLGERNGKPVIQAQFTRTFSDRRNPSRIVGILTQMCLCDDAYLNEMAEGDTLPSVCNSHERTQEFTLVQGNGVHVPIGRISYNKARRMSENQTTFFGRIRNWVLLHGL